MSSSGRESTVIVDVAALLEGAATAGASVAVLTAKGLSAGAVATAKAIGEASRLSWQAGEEACRLAQSAYRAAKVAAARMGAESHLQEFNRQMARFTAEPAARLVPAAELEELRIRAKELSRRIEVFNNVTSIGETAVDAKLLSEDLAGIEARGQAAMTAREVSREARELAVVESAAAGLDRKASRQFDSDGLNLLDAALRNAKLALDRQSPTEAEKTRELANARLAQHRRSVAVGSKDAQMQCIRAAAAVDRAEERLTGLRQHSEVIQHQARRLEEIGRQVDEMRRELQGDSGPSGSADVVARVERWMHVAERVVVDAKHAARRKADQEYTLRSLMDVLNEFGLQATRVESAEASGEAGPQNEGAGVIVAKGAGGVSVGICVGADNRVVEEVNGLPHTSTRVIDGQTVYTCDEAATSLLEDIHRRLAEKSGIRLTPRNDAAGQAGEDQADDSSDAEASTIRPARDGERTR